MVVVVVVVLVCSAGKKPIGDVELAISKFSGKIRFEFDKKMIEMEGGLYTCCLGDGDTEDTVLSAGAVVSGMFQCL